MSRPGDRTPQSSGSDFSFCLTFILSPSLMNCEWMVCTEEFGPEGEARGEEEAVEQSE